MNPRNSFQLRFPFIESTKNSPVSRYPIYEFSPRSVWVDLVVSNWCKYTAIRLDRSPWNKWKNHKLLRHASNSTSCPRKRLCRRRIVNLLWNCSKHSKTESICTCWWKVAWAVNCGPFWETKDISMMERPDSTRLVWYRHSIIYIHGTLFTGMEGTWLHNELWFVVHQSFSSLSTNFLL